MMTSLKPPKTVWRRLLQLLFFDHRARSRPPLTTTVDGILTVITTDGSCYSNRSYSRHLRELTEAEATEATEATKATKKQPLHAKAVAGSGSASGSASAVSTETVASTIHVIHTVCLLRNPAT